MQAIAPSLSSINDPFSHDPTTPSKILKNKMTAHFNKTAASKSPEFSDDLSAFDNPNYYDKPMKSMVLSRIIEDDDDSNQNRVKDPRKSRMREAQRKAAKEAEELAKAKALAKAKPTYDYTTLLMYIPDKIQPKTTKATSKNFNSFNDLVKAGREEHNRLLEDIFTKNTTLKNEGKALEEKGVPMDLVKQILTFNKIQKRTYAQQVATQKKNIILPLIKEVEEITKKTPQVKVMPSRKLYEHSSMLDFVMMEPRATFPNESMSAGLPNGDNSLTINKMNSKPSDASYRKSVNSKTKEESPVEPTFIAYNYKVFWYHGQSNKAMWKPSIREGHTFTTVGNKIVLYGGLNTALQDEIIYYDPVKNLWDRPQVTGDIPMSGRHGHTACEYKKNLVIFGGEQEFNATLNIRECLNDTLLYSADKHEWKYVKTMNHNIAARRYHAATVHDRHMYVYGGISTEGTYLRDLWSLNLKNYSWERVEISGDKESGLAFHTMAACYIDKQTISLAMKDNKPKMHEEGIYVFGGKDSQGRPNNKLKMFTTDSKTPQWRYPEVKGQLPTARYGHSMTFYEPLCLLIVYGGRNESLYESSSDVCLNDIRILNLEQMAWQAVSSYGDAPHAGRFHHRAAPFGSKIIIFGGMEFKKLADDETRAIELNQGKIRKIIDMDTVEDTVLEDQHYSHHPSKARHSSLPPILKKKDAKKPVLFEEESTITKSKLFKEVETPKYYLSYQPLPRSTSYNMMSSSVKIINQTVASANHAMFQKYNIKKVSGYRSDK